MEQGVLGLEHHRVGPLWDLVAVLENLRSRDPRLGLREARLFAAARVADHNRVTDLSGDRLAGVWERFERFAAAHGVRLVADVTPALVERFVHALGTGQRPPSIATMHLRRSAVRLLFKILGEFGIADADPTARIVLPPRSGLAVRALTDDEVEAGRWAALATVMATRQPAVWALGEAGASTMEIACATGDDVNLAEGTVWLSGGSRTIPRLVPLTPWGTTQLARRLRVLGPASSGRVAFDKPMGDQAGRAKAGATLNAILGRAGLAGEADVKPRSLTGWVGRRVWLETGRIEDAARRLGMQSLDLTVELIGVDWLGGDERP